MSAGGACTLPASLDRYARLCFFLVDVLGWLLAAAPLMIRTILGTKPSLGEAKLVDNCFRAGRGASLVPGLSFRAVAVWKLVLAKASCQFVSLCRLCGTSGGSPLLATALYRFLNNPSKAGCLGNNIG